MSKGKTIGMLFTGMSVALAFIGWMPPPGGPGFTAKTGFPKALTTATQWKADVILTGISAMHVSPDGTANYRVYGFHSPSTGKFFKVN